MHFPSFLVAFSMLDRWSTLPFSLPHPPSLFIESSFPLRLCFENLSSFFPLLFFVAPELKFGHRSATSLSTHILAADRNWGMASYVLKIALHLSTSIIFIIFLPNNMTLLTQFLRHYKPQTLKQPHTMSYSSYYYYLVMQLISLT